jgi:dolichol-phosphate mannosyltransferase
MLATTADHIAVIDADLQHDETLLPRMLARLRTGDADLAVGSRFLAPEDAVEGLSPLRRWGSGVANALARLALKARVSDPVSGFFMIRRALIERVAPKLTTEGFKVLFDIIASQPEPLRVVEEPYVFRERLAGGSKLDRRVVVDYLGLLLSKLSGGIIPTRALMFGLVGASGLVVQLLALKGFLVAGLEFSWAQFAASMVAMTSNYLINNEVTYRDRRLRGGSLLIGYLRFCALCGVGLIANVAVADLAQRHLHLWWAAGFLGAVFGAVWNYVSTSLAVW